MEAVHHQVLKHPVTHALLIPGSSYHGHPTRVKKGPQGSHGGHLVAQLGSGHRLLAGLDRELNRDIAALVRLFHRKTTLAKNPHHGPVISLSHGKKAPETGLSRDQGQSFQKQGAQTFASQSIIDQKSHLGSFRVFLITNITANRNDPGVVRAALEHHQAVALLEITGAQKQIGRLLGRSSRKKAAPDRFHRKALQKFK